MALKLVRLLIIPLLLAFADIAVAQTYLPNGKASKDMFGEFIQCNNGGFVVYKKPGASHEGLLRLTTSPEPSSGHIFISATIHFKTQNRHYESVKVDSAMYALGIDGAGHGIATWKADTSEVPPTDPFSEDQKPPTKASSSVSLDCHFQPTYPSPTGFSAGN